MSKRNNRTQSNTAASNINSLRVKSHYVSKHSEKLTVEFNGKQIEVRRVWDSKKQDLRKELKEISQMQDTLKRSLSVIAACLQAVGIEWSEAPIKEVGTVEWKEGDDVYEAPALRIKFLKNGGQVRMVRNPDGTEHIDLDVVTKTTVSQCIADVQAWSDEDQEALDNHTAAMKRRKADKERHERYERNYVSTFSCDEVFTNAGL